MKKAYIALILMLATAGLHARNDGITLRFSAKHTCTFAELDRIVIENLTQGGSQVLYYPDTVITFTTTDIPTVSGAYDALYVSQNYPNPFSVKTQIDVYVPGSDLFYIKVYDITGRQVTAHERWLEQGMHHFDFYACNKQTYIFTVSSRIYVENRLMIQLGNAGNSSSRIIYNGEASTTKRETQQAKTQQKSSSEFGFTIGDELRLTGYVDDGYGNEDHEVITDTPTADTDYLFDMANTKPEQASEIAGKHTVAAYETGLTYEVTPVPGVTYQWAVPDDWTITGGQGTHAITADAGVASGEISVVAENACGTSPERTQAVTVHVTLTLIALPTEGGTVTGGGTYEEDTEVSLTATPAEGWAFVNWTGDTDHIADPASPTTTVTMPASDITLTAHFEMIDYTLTLVASPTQGGSVSGGGEYHFGDQVQLEAVTDNGWAFVNWTGEDNMEVSSQANFIYTMPANDVTLTANFEEEDTTTEVVDVTNPVTGRTWMDRNLGASRAATSSTDEEAYGDLYQWGRAADGHQKRTSGNTSTLSSSDTPGHNNFILAPNEPSDWRSPQNNNLWQGVNGVNNPCPPGYRVPTEAELNAERLSWGSNNSAGAFASPLQLPFAGFRSDRNGSLFGAGSFGYYWSSTVDGINARAMDFSSDGAYMYYSFRAFGYSVRCLKDTGNETETYTLNLEVTPPEAGSAQGAGEYQAGEQVSISATANPDWEFVSWMDSTSGVVTTTAEYDFVMPAGNLTLTANFQQEPGIETGTFTDSRDDEVYRWVKIGDQVWMAENLRYLSSVIGSGTGSETDPYSYVFDYDGTDVSAAKETNNYQYYGVLYNWSAAMSGASSSSTNPSDVQGVCPPGWHVPSDAEWTQLVDYVVSQGYPNEDVANGAGNVLKSCRQVSSPLGEGCNTSDHPRWNAHDTHYGTDAFGFSALPGGHRSVTGFFNSIGGVSSWWSATERSTTHSWGRGISNKRGFIGRGSDEKTFGLSIRCVKDADTEVVDVTNPTTGKTWMDRNLGASHAATSSTDEEAFGDLYQWGRGTDGHEKRTSGNTSTLSSSDTPGHSNFINSCGNPYDWLSPQNDALWQGVGGTNNPCPQDYRLPTEAELEAERQSWSSNNSAGAFDSPLKLPVAGYRSDCTGSLNDVGSSAYYWSSTVSGVKSYHLYFSNDDARMGNYYRAYGRSVRCIKE